MRLIDADELRRKMCYKCIDTDEETEKGRAKWDSGLWIRYKVFEDTLTDAPTVDAVEVVRCKDCTHNKTLQKGTFGDTIGYDGECNIVRMFIRDNYYCVWGEKDKT